VQIFKRYNDFGYKTLEKIKNEINSFINDNTRMTFDERYNLNNSAGIFGVVFFLMWILVLFKIFR